ncbi:hypothetical protein OGAPHI_004149 [Ogataea philodendri]|uniref:Phospholipid scramblase n=1 Tax=Ogataea philodendri TaxID=1378263 RepID=A0A9P8T5C6_9ASCO|nr:uncharacterized protein OGAPHI_004149 [Ogataea philodendri]KAH3665960.1 hypothetical protein OGAPHI_004149 [Ogataea philodendri]
MFSSNSFEGQIGGEIFLVICPAGSVLFWRHQARNTFLGPSLVVDQFRHRMDASGKLLHRTHLISTGKSLKNFRRSEMVVCKGQYSFLDKYSIMLMASLRWSSPVTKTALLSRSFLRNRSLYTNSNRGMRKTTGTGSQNGYYGASQHNNYIYTENPGGIISHSDPLADILSQPTLVIQRQIEYMNLFLGFEQANKYVVMDSLGNQLGWLMERDLGFTNTILRQVYRLHRPFTVDMFDNAGNLLMTIRRPFSIVNSHIKTFLPSVVDPKYPDGALIGESVQSWHLWRRRYNLFKSAHEDSFDQFGAIDAGFLSWEFPVRAENGTILGAVSRNFVGFAREFFTDTGIYVIRMDPLSFQGLEDVYSPIANEGMTLDQKAILVANAVSIDFDYFSRHSSGPGGGGISYLKHDKKEHLSSETNNTTSWSQTGVTSFQRVGVATLTQVIGTGVNNNGSSQNGVLTQELDERVLLSTLSQSVGVGGDVAEVTNVSLRVLWSTVVLAEWVEVRTSRSTSIGVVTKLVNVESSQSIWIVTGNFPGNSGWIGFGRLFESNNSLNSRITSHDSD